MTVHRWQDMLDHAPPFDRPVRLTLGVFDGLHVGHRRLMEGIAAGRGEALPLVITFRRSPAQLLAPGSFPGLILTHEQKVTRLAGLGVGAVVVIDFSEEIGHLSGETFIGLLRENLAIQKIVVGQSFRFGRSRDSGTDDLKEMLSGTETEVQVTEPVLRGGSVVSSSRIRMTIREADFAEARAMLAAEYALDLRGIPVRPAGPGRLTVQRRDVDQVLPKPGEYQVVCAGPAGDQQGTLVVGSESLTITGRVRGGITTVLFP